MKKRKQIIISLLVACMLCGGIGAISLTQKATAETTAVDVMSIDLITNQSNVSTITQYTDTLYASEPVRGLRIVGSSTTYSFSYKYAVNINEFNKYENLFNVQTECPQGTDYHVNNIYYRISDSLDSDSYVELTFGDGDWTYTQDGCTWFTDHDARTNSLAAYNVKTDGTVVSYNLTGEQGKKTGCNKISLRRAELSGWNWEPMTLAYDADEKGLYVKNAGSQSEYVFNLDLDTVITSGKAELSVIVETNSTKAGIIVNQLGGVSLEQTNPYVVDSAAYEKILNVNNTTEMNLRQVDNAKYSDGTQGIRVYGRSKTYSFRYADEITLDGLTRETDLFSIQTDSLANAKRITNLKMRIMDSVDETNYVEIDYTDGDWGYYLDDSSASWMTIGDSAYWASGRAYLSVGGTISQYSFTGTANKYTSCNHVNLGRSNVGGGWMTGAWGNFKVAYDSENDKIIVKDAHGSKSNNVVTLTDFAIGADTVGMTDKTFADLFTSGKVKLQVTATTNSVYEAGLIVNTLGGRNFVENTKENVALSVAKSTITFKADGEVVDEILINSGESVLEEPAVPEKAGFIGYWAPYDLNSGDVTVNAVYVPDGIFALSNVATVANDQVSTAKEAYRINGVRVLGSTTNYSFMSKYTVKLADLTTDTDLFKVETDVGNKNANNGYINNLASSKHVTKLTYKLVDAADSSKSVSIVFKDGCYTYTQDGCDWFTADTARTDSHSYLLFADGETTTQMSWTGTANSEDCMNNYSLARGDLMGWTWNAKTIAYDAATTTLTAKLANNNADRTYVYDLSTILTSGYAYAEVEVETNDTGIGVLVNTLGGVKYDGSQTTLPELYEYTVTFKADEKVVAVKNYTFDKPQIEEPAVPEKAGFIGEWEKYELSGNVTVNAKYVPDAILNLKDVESQTRYQEAIKCEESMTGTRVMGNFTNFEFMSKYAIKISDLTTATDLFKVKTDVSGSKHVTQITFKLVDCEDSSRYIAIVFKDGCYTYTQDGCDWFTNDTARTDSHSYILFSDGNYVTQISWTGNQNGEDCMNNNSLAHADIWKMNPMTIAYDAATTTLTAKKAHSSNDRTYAYDIASILTSGYAYAEVIVDTNSTDVGVLVNTLGGIKYDGTQTELPELYQYTVEYLLNGETYQTFNYVYGEEVPEPEFNTSKYSGVSYFYDKPQRNKSCVVNVVLDIADKATNYYYAGAAIRLMKTETDLGAIRFYIYISEEIYDLILLNEGEYDVSFGTLLLPQDMLGGAELTINTPYVKNVETPNMFDEEIDGVNYKYSLVYIYDIPVSNFSRGICARGYIKIGNDYFYTNESDIVRSVSYVASAAFEDENESQSVKDAIYKYVPKVVLHSNDSDNTTETIVYKTTDELTYTIPEKAFEGNNKSLLGWTMNGEEVEFGTTFTVNGTVDLYAIWYEGEIIQFNDTPANYAIVVPDDAVESEVYASEELSSYIYEATGATVKTYRDNESLPAGYKTISLGKTEQLANANLAFDYQEMKDGFYLYILENGNIYIDADTQRGVLYGVYELLEKYVGIKFLAEDYYYIPTKTAESIVEINFTPISLKSVPDFEMRTAFCTLENADTISKMRFLDPFGYSDDKYGENLYDYWDVVGHSIMTNYMNPNWYPDNSDWYYSVDGVAQQLCLTNADAKTELLRLLKNNLSIKGVENFFLGIGDNGNYCQCTNCVAKINELGSVTDLYVSYMNGIADELQSYADNTYPTENYEIQIGMFAMHFCTEAPTSVKINDNVFVMFAPLGYTIDYQQGKGLDLLISEWKNCWETSSYSNFSVWDYQVQYTHYLNWIPKYKNGTSSWYSTWLNTYKENDFWFVCQQNSTGESKYYANRLDAYVASKMLWDSSLNPLDLVAEFNQYYFGEIASSYVNSYVTAMNNLTLKNGYYPLGDIPTNYYKIQYLSPKAYLENAITAINNSSLSQAEKDVYIRRVAEVIVMPLYNLTLLDKTTYAEDFIKYADMIGLHRVAENMTYEEYKQSLLS